MREQELKKLIVEEFLGLVEAPQVERTRKAVTFSDRACVA